MHISTCMFLQYMMVNSVSDQIVIMFLIIRISATFSRLQIK